MTSHSAFTSGQIFVMRWCLSVWFIQILPARWFLKEFYPGINYRTLWWWFNMVEGQIGNAYPERQHPVGFLCSLGSVQVLCSFPLLIFKEGFSGGNAHIWMSGYRELVGCLQWSSRFHWPHFCVISFFYSHACQHFRVASCVCERDLWLSVSTQIWINRITCLLELDTGLCFPIKWISEHWLSAALSSHNESAAAYTLGGNQSGTASALQALCV